VFAGEVAAALRTLDERFGRPVSIATDPSFDRHQFQITPV
jgi:hypothetical protein